MKVMSIFARLNQARLSISTLMLMWLSQAQSSIRRFSNLTAHMVHVSTRFEDLNERLALILGRTESLFESQIPAEKFEHLERLIEELRQQGQVRDNEIHRLHHSLEMLWHEKRVTTNGQVDQSGTPKEHVVAWHVNPTTTPAAK